MDNSLVLSKARYIRSVNAKSRRDQAIFTLNFRSGASEQVIGYDNLAQRLSIKVTSIPVLLSQGGGTSFDLQRPNPLHGEPDICTVTRFVPSKEPKRRGRPRKNWHDPCIDEISMQAPCQSQHKRKSKAPVTPLTQQKDKRHKDD